MVSTFTPNVQLEEPARGDDVGTWDVPANGNTTNIDLLIGAITTIGLNNANVVLSAAQYRSRMIILNSTLTGSVNLTFPTSFIKDYVIWNQCTGSSAFTVTMGTTASGAQVVCPPPGDQVQVYNDGANINFMNLGRVGTYWDYAGSSVPAWVSGCSPKVPFLNCDGSVIASSLYPMLPIILGSSLLPNSQGKYRVALNQSASTPISSGTNGLFTASSVGVVGGTQATTLSSRHLPQLSDPGHSHSDGTSGLFFNGNASGYPNTGADIAHGNNGATLTATTGITYGSSSQIVVPGLPPSYVGGLVLIRTG